ncbi:hypothetical protein [Pseudomonas putida]|uniref:Right handed beta helix domain-containing protein n=1 Tax=Pseudomonas putida TaxID=303 RepID=A0A1L5PNC3_PSEPU|nr:hypothetical protein [Pseudomonas putida]APO81664.1 hypothetical protein BL240_09485 [Pseudomonas putida]
MRYNTGNPVGADCSSSPFDLHDNSGNIDVWANDRSRLTWPDRLGVERKTFFGMEQQVNDFLANQGFEPVPLVYVDGIGLTVERPTQLIERGDNLYSINLPASFPVELSGNWAADQSLLVAQVDRSLREELSDSTDPAKGAALVGYKRSRLTSAIDTAREALDAQPYSIFEFESYVINKPTALDPSTWDWAPAIAAALTLFTAEGGGVLVFPAGYSFPCRTKVGSFPNLKNVTLVGYGAEIVNYTGPLPMIVFGDATVDGTGRFTSFAVTVENVNVFGISFRSGNPFGSGTPGSDRWADATPFQFNTSRRCVVRDCSFTDLDFSAIDFGAASRDCLVDRCRFYSSRTEAGHANYGVRIFCYSTSVNVDLSPTDPTTGLLKTGYTLPPGTGNFGHENISVTNCYFENISHGVMTFAARRGTVSNNKFVNLSTRSVSLTTYTTDYLCYGNVHTLNTVEQPSSGVSVFYNFGQETFRNSVKGDKFLVFGAMNNATGFSPIKALLSAKGIVIESCEFNLESFNGGNGQFCIVVNNNSDARVSNCRFSSGLGQSICFSPTDSIANPGFNQPNIEISRNTFVSSVNGSIQLGNTTVAGGNFIIKDNVIEGGATRFVVNTASSATSVPRLALSGNRFVNSPVRYVDNTTTNKAIIRSTDVLEILTRLSTTAGVANPSTTSVTFDFSNYTIPACFSNGAKQYQFSAYGGRENSQASTDFIFRITGETATSVTGDIVRNAGTSTQTGYVSLRVLFTPFNT